VEADFQRFYQMPLSHALAEEPWRRVMVLVRQLPLDCRTWFAMFGEAAMWGPSEYLLAATVDALNGANWQRAGGKGRRPQSWPRPGQATPGEKRFGNKKLTIDEYHKRMDRRRAARHVAEEG
jgi:hypothetical protein